MEFGLNTSNFFVRSSPSGGPVRNELHVGSTAIGRNLSHVFTTAGCSVAQSSNIAKELYHMWLYCQRVKIVYCVLVKSRNAYTYIFIFNFSFRILLRSVIYNRSRLFQCFYVYFLLYFSVFFFCTTYTLKLFYLVISAYTFVICSLKDQSINQSRLLIRLYLGIKHVLLDCIVLLRTIVFFGLIIINNSYTARIAWKICFCGSWNLCPICDVLSSSECETDLT